MSLDVTQAPAFRRLLLRWYDRSQRTLPWRAVRPDKPHPYHVLVSETMLQQTQVATVIAYFNRFLAAFPTIAALAAAPEQEVLRLWQGLGYYRRARNLHKAARQVVELHGGEIPDDVASLRELPGVGRYTAGALASIAFGQRAALVDGNVARVLARWFAVRQPIDDPKVRQKLWTIAEQLMPASRPGDFNQALMELGALVCTPRQPGCVSCPVVGLCGAHACGLADQLPRQAARRKAKLVEHYVLAIGCGDQLLFVQRPEKGLWSNMWQLPTMESPEINGDPAARLRGWAREELGVRVSRLQPAGEFDHQTTHRRIKFVLWTAQATTKGRMDGGARQWRNPGNVSDLPLSNPQRKVLALLSSDLPAQ